MEFEGRIWKDDKDPGWLVEVPSLNVMTQGVTRKEALFMIGDAIKLLMEDVFGDIEFEITVQDYHKDRIGIGCSDSNLLTAFALRRQRESNHLTIRDAARRLGSSSPNAYARYEQGRIKPTIQKYEKLLHAVNPRSRGLLVR